MLNEQLQKRGISYNDADKSLAIASEVVELRSELKELSRKNEELQEQMASPQELLAKMSTPQKRKFESMELERCVHSL